MAVFWADGRSERKMAPIKFGVSIVFDVGGARGAQLCFSGCPRLSEPKLDKDPIKSLELNINTKKMRKLNVKIQRTQ